MLQVENLTVTYPDGTRAVDGLTLHAAPGESIALVGANGAGKTSLLMALLGILPAGGAVRIDGVTLESDTAAQIRQRAGLVFQDPDDQLFMPRLYDDLAFGLRNQGLTEAAAAARIDETLAALGIAHLKEKTTLKLSGGEKRMAALACVLVMQPAVLLLDEPTAFLDPRARRGLIRTLQGLSQTRLIATHDLAFAAQVCSRAVVLQSGRIAADGPARTLLYDAAQMGACGVEAIGVDEKELARL